jgi:hypothetical protein
MAAVMAADRQRVALETHVERVAKAMRSTSRHHDPTAIQMPYGWWWRGLKTPPYTRDRCFISRGEIMCSAGSSDPACYIEQGGV